ncbi:MAG: glycosyltransferase family 2 protein [Phycisphaeraceae bacterium]
MTPVTNETQHDTSGSSLQDHALPIEPSSCVAVVIVNHNGGDKLTKTIAAIANQSRAVEKVVVVDSASDDGSPDHALQRYPQIELIKLEDNVGPCVTRNTGVEACAASSVLLLDSDVYVQADTIEALIRAKQETGASVVCPRIVLVPEGDIQCEGATNHFLGTSGMRHGWMPIDQVEAERAAVPGAISAALLVDRDFYKRAGGFDAILYFYYEDLEFSLRVRALGGTIVCEPDAVVLHDRGSGTAGLSFRGKGGYPARRMYLQLRNRLMLVLIYYRLQTLLVLLPALALYEGVSLGAAVAKGAGKQWFRAWSGIVSMRSEIRTRRRRIQRERTTPDRDILSGGPVPLAPGFVSHPLVGFVVGVLNVCFGAYWKLAKHLIG